MVSKSAFRHDTAGVGTTAVPARTDRNPHSALGSGASSNSAFRNPHSAFENGVLIGTSGYNYPHWWKDVFYPSSLPQRQWLEYYARHFNTVELNVSFYRLPDKEVFKSWHRRTPNDFSFAVKGSRFITHIKRLKDCREPLSRLMDHASPLKEKLGVFLWQLPPRFRFEKERLEKFCVLLSTLPRSRRLRHAFEFRNESWFCQDAIRILEEFNFALCIAHGSGLPLAPQLTSDFAYLRLHGGEVLFASNYSDRELMAWVEKIGEWKKKSCKTIFVYFNNDAYGFAVKNALTLRGMVSSL